MQLCNMHHDVISAIFDAPVGLILNIAKYPGLAPAGVNCFYSICRKKSRFNLLNINDIECI